MIKLLEKLIGCKHPYWSAPDAEGIQYCLNCNISRSEHNCVKNGHNWKYDEKTNVSTCSRCGERKCNHKWETDQAIRVFGKDNKEIPTHLQNSSKKDARSLAESYELLLK